MFNKILNFILSLPRFNPYGLKLIDLNSKLECKIKDRILLSSYIHQEDSWAIQLLSRECYSDYEEFMNFFEKVFPIPFIDPYSLNYI